MADSDDEPISLSLQALDALKDFYSERDSHTERFERLRVAAEENAAPGKVLHIESFPEDWQESQFWYCDETANLVAKQLLDGATEETTIAAVSVPSVFIALKNLLNKAGSDKPKPKLLLLEHDDRFRVFPEFQYYDFNEPFKLPPELKGGVDCIVIDPPFLNEDCQTKYALTARWLAKSPKIATAATAPRIIVITGERMQYVVNKVYKAFGLRKTTYEPVHGNKLSNEFLCHATFECKDWRWSEEENGTNGTNGVANGVNGVHGVNGAIY